MPDLRIYLGQWYDNTGTNMTPNTEVVGGSGSVDDDLDISYVCVRAEQINSFIGAQLSTFDFFPAAAALPNYADVQNPRIDFHVRHEIVETPTELPTEAWRLSTQGTLSSFIGVAGASQVGSIVESHPTFPTESPYTLAAGRWNDIRNGALQVNISVNRDASLDIVNPVTFEDYPPGTSIEINIYEILVVVSWDVTGPTPARLVYPRTDSVGPANGRLYPPPNTQQTGSRFGSSSPL